MSTHNFVGLTLEEKVLKFYYTASSPFARKVRILLAEMKLAHEGVDVSPGDAAQVVEKLKAEKSLFGDDYEKLVPSLRVPAIQDGDQLIFESNAIMTYLYQKGTSISSESVEIPLVFPCKINSRKRPNLLPWKKITNIVLKTKRTVNIAIIGKYVNLKDAYKSLDEALTHGGISNKVKVNLIRIESDKLRSKEIKSKLKNVSGILIPGGFGKRGTEGKIEAIRYARERKIPFLGICFGMQMAMIEFARNRLKIKKAGSSELDKSCFPVIGLIDEWNKDGKIIKGTDKNLGGTMRLGLYEAKLRNNSAIKNIYKSNMIKERHRHRYEVNINLMQKFEKKGLMFSGISPDNQLPEIIELKNHPWFIGVQFHPEFKSRPLNPHPLFSSFIKAAKSFNGK